MANMENLDTRHIAFRFDKSLNTIRSHVIDMGKLINEQLKLALSALLENKPEIVSKVRTQENVIDNAEILIDKECELFLVRQNPAATDLRTIIACSKIIIDMERIGDEANRIAKQAKRIAKQEGGVQILANFPEFLPLSQQTQKLLGSALEAFENIDLPLAQQVILEDKGVDSGYKEAMTALEAIIANSNPQTVKSALNLIWATRSLERIADHATNIAEYTIYIGDGEYVRHS